MNASIDLNQLRVFVAVHETGSFAAAAAKLGIPRSTVSRSVSGLESVIGARLFHRTTRKVSTTTAGLALYDSVAAPLSALQASLAELPRHAEVPTGTLRVTTTADLGATVVAEVTARYVKRYPSARVEVDLRTDIVDLVGEGFDLALRVTTKRFRDSSLLVQRVGSYALRLYASPVYLARRGEPRTISDLGNHSFVGLDPNQLKLAGIESRVDSSDFFFCRELLRAGTGIGALPPFLAAAEIAAGELVQVLPRWAAPTGTVYIVQPSRKHLPAKSRAFRDLLVELFQERTL